MATYVFSKNGMGNYTTSTGMREDMHMQYANILNYRAGVVLTTDLAVTERGAGANMSVDVSAGRCFIQNSSYTANTANSTKYWGLLSDAVTNLAISTNTSGSTRIDKIVAKIDTTAIANDYATNVGSIIVVEGTPGAGAPATPSNCLLLATLTIPTGTTVSITNAMITNGRVYPGLTFQTAYMLDDGTNLELHSTTGNIHIYDSSRDVRLRIYDSAGGSGFLDLYHDGSNGQIATGAGDLDIVPTGGDVRLRSGTDLQIFDNANTANAEISMGTNLDIITTSGDISFAPATSKVVMATGTETWMYNPAGTVYTSFARSTTALTAATSSGRFDVTASILRINNIAGTTNVDISSDGTNSFISNSGDLYFTPVGGDVVLRSGTNLVIYNGADTQSLTIDVGTNTLFQITTGNMDIFDGSHNIHLRIFGSGGGSQNLEMYHDGTNASIITGTGDMTIAPADADVNFTSDVNPTTTDIYSLGDTTHHWNIAYVQEAWVYASGSTTNLTTLSQDAGGFSAQTNTGSIFLKTSTSGTGIDFETGSSAEWIYLPNVTSDPGSLSDGMMWYRSDTDVLRVRVNGVTRSVTVT